jgi:hypothetical protein
MKYAAVINIMLMITAADARKGVRRNPETHRELLVRVVESEALEAPAIFLASSARKWGL